MDLKLFLLINNAAGRWPWLDRVMIFSADYLWYLMIIAVLVILATDYKRWKNLAIVSIGSAIVARGVVAEIIKLTYHRARPYWTVAETHLLLAKETESSFPSGHTIFVFALATGVYLYNKKAGTWFYLLACLVGFARIFVGVHWPSDILGGIILGVFTGLACDWVFRKYRHVVGL